MIIIGDQVNFDQEKEIGRQLAAQIDQEAESAFTRHGIKSEAEKTMIVAFAISRFLERYKVS